LRDKGPSAQPFLDHSSVLDLLRKAAKKLLARPSTLCVTVGNVMNGNSIPPHEPGEFERDVLLIVVRHGYAAADKVREDLDRARKDSTVGTVFRRLEGKGYRARSAGNCTFVDRPSESGQRVAARAAKPIADWFCDSSVETLLVGTVDSKARDRAELQHLADRILVAQKVVPSAPKEAL
jgi:predicted transcriptional regulator